MSQFFLVNRANGNLLFSNSQSKEAYIDAYDPDLNDTAQAIEIKSVSGVGDDTYTIKDLSLNKYLTYLDGSDGPEVKFSAASASHSEATWSVDVVDKISKFDVWEIYSQNGGVDTFLAADDDGIVTFQRQNGQPNQQWLKIDPKTKTLAALYQAMLADNKRDVAQDEDTGDDQSGMVEGKDAAGWLKVAREIFKNGVSMYQWGPISTEQEELGQRYWFRGFDAIYN